MKKIFVSGTYDILHAGHIQFFKDARSLGDYLIVSFCSEPNLMLYKKRKASMPDDNKKVILESIRFVDKVYKGTDNDGVWDFVPAFLREKPDILAVTEDDLRAEEKADFCRSCGWDCQLVVLPKTKPESATQVCTSGVISEIKKGAS